MLLLIKDELNMSKPDRQPLGFICSLIIFIMLSVPLFSQAGHLKFERISIEKGLSQSVVYSIYQDSRGFLWIGTQDGLNRYDGYSFRVYK
ncbi:MAG: two-component regulator propeller domain-containing protein [Syntrophothermus sp.]